jgi:hypothetical protein
MDASPMPTRHTNMIEAKMSVNSSDVNSLSIHVPITNSLQRLLERAALKRDLTSEALAQRILCEWLLAEGGFSQRDVLPKQSRKNISVNGALNV